MAGRKRVSVPTMAVRWYVSPQAVHDLIKRGKLSPPGPDGLLDFELACAEYEAHVRPRADADAAVPAGTDAEADAALVSTSPSYRDARARLAYIQAERAAMELRRDSGRLMVRTDVEACTRDMATIYRTGVEDFANRLPSQLAALGADEARIRALLADEGERLLRSIADRFAELQRQQPAPDEALPS